MKAVVIYDTFFGNTEQIAQAVGKALSSQVETSVFRISEMKLEQLEGVDLIVFGSPTRAFRPTKPLTAFLDSIPKNAIRGARVAAFDTRISVEDANSNVLRFMVKIFGYGADTIANRLKKKGWDLVAPPEGFYVKASEGPLKDGELERAANWALRLIKT